MVYYYYYYYYYYIVLYTTLHFVIRCITGTKKPGSYPDEEAPKPHTETGRENIAILCRKNRKHTQWVNATIRV